MSVRLSVRSLGFLRFSWFFISGKFVQLRATLSKTNFNILEALSCQGDFVDICQAYATRCSTLPPTKLRLKCSA